MNKLDFLRKLDKYLEVLDREERREILSFYEERFYTGTIYENKTEEEVIAELESPEAIARNVLAEYGASPKYVKTKAERNTNSNVGQIVLLLIFDALVVSWLVPALFGVMVSLFGSVLTYVTAFPLILGERSTVDEFVFFFMTGGYVLLFLFALVVLEAFLWVCKKLIIWHLNVFKIGKRDKVIKAISHISVEKWFKNHPKLKTLKNLLLVASLVSIVYTGYWLINHNDWVRAEYQTDTVIDEVLTEDFTSEITDLDEWVLITDLENMEIEVVLVDSPNFVIKHTSLEEDHFEYEFDKTENTLTIENDYPNFGFVWGIEELFRYVDGQQNRVVLEVPKNLVLNTLELSTSNAVIKANSLHADQIALTTSNARIILNDVEVDDVLNLKTSNADIILRRITSNDGSLLADTSNGAIDIEEALFNTYDLESSNGRIEVSNLNVENQDGVSLKAKTSNSRIDLENVYVDVVDLDTSNGAIDYYNDDTSYHPSSFTKDTSNANISTNVTKE